MKTIKRTIKKSKMMFFIFISKENSEEEKKGAKEQLKEVRNVIILTPIFILPGGSFMIPIVVNVSKKMGIDLMPKKTFYKNNQEK